jgi:copper transport protein
VFRVLEAGESPQATPEPVLGPTGIDNTTASTGEQNPSPIHWIVRALVLVCITFCLGGAIFLVLVVEPTMEERGLEDQGMWPSLGLRFAQLGAVAAAAMIPLLTIDLWSQVAAISETDLAGAFGRADLGSLLISTTRYGFAWTMKLLAAVVLFSLFLYVWMRRRGGSGIWEVAIAAGSLFLLAESLSSHAAAVQGESVAGLPLPVISDWVHLVTASTWIGGLLFFLLVLFPIYRKMRLPGDERSAFLAAAVPRFSRLALVSVLALGVSGTYNLAIQTTDLPAIASSLYGQVVGLKILLFGALIAVGAVNLAYLSPRLRLSRNEEAGSAVSDFRRNVRLEVALMCIVILCAGGLTLLPPPSAANPVAASEDQVQGGLTLPTSPALAPSPTSSQPTLPVAAATLVAGTPFTLAVERLEAGEVYSLTIGPGATGATVLTDVTKLLLTVSPQGVEAGSTILEAERVEQATEQGTLWVTRASVLAFQGDYLITAAAQRITGHDIKAAFWLSLAGEEQLRLRPTEYLEAQFRTVPEPPTLGKARVIVAMRGPTGEPVGGITTAFSAAGPSGSQLAAQPMIPEGASEAGQYAVDVEFPVAGAWVLKVSAMRAGQPELKFSASVDVQEKVSATP